MKKEMLVAFFVFAIFFLVISNVQAIPTSNQNPGVTSSVKIVYNVPIGSISPVGGLPPASKILSIYNQVSDAVKAQSQPPAPPPKPEPKPKTLWGDFVNGAGKVADVVTSVPKAAVNSVVGLASIIKTVSDVANNGPISYSLSTTQEDYDKIAAKYAGDPRPIYQIPEAMHDLSTAHWCVDCVSRMPLSPKAGPYISAATNIILNDPELLTSIVGNKDAAEKLGNFVKTDPVAGKDVSGFLDYIGGKDSPVPRMKAGKSAPKMSIEYNPEKPDTAAVKFYDGNGNQVGEYAVDEPIKVFGQVAEAMFSSKSPNGEEYKKQLVASLQKTVIDMKKDEQLASNPPAGAEKQKTTPETLAEKTKELTPDEKAAKDELAIIEAKKKEIIENESKKALDELSRQNMEQELEQEPSSPQIQESSQEACTPGETPDDNLTCSYCNEEGQWKDWCAEQGKLCGENSQGTCYDCLDNCDPETQYCDGEGNCLDINQESSLQEESSVSETEEVCEFYSYDDTLYNCCVDNWPDTTECYCAYWYPGDPNCGAYADTECTPGESDWVDCGDGSTYYLANCDSSGTWNYDDYYNSCEYA